MLLALVVVLLYGCRHEADREGFSAFVARGRSYTGSPAWLGLRDGRGHLEVGGAQVQLEIRTAGRFDRLADLVGRTVPVEGSGTIAIPAADYPHLRITGGEFTLQSLAGGRAQGNYDLNATAETQDGTRGPAVEVVGSFQAPVRPPWTDVQARARPVPQGHGRR